MSKELTPLEAFYDLIDVYFDNDIVKEKYGITEKTFNEKKKIVENALKNYQELTNRPITLGARTHGRAQAIIDMICKNYKEVKIINLEDEKKLKALEIIKEQTQYFIDFVENTRTIFIDCALKCDTKQFDLLKEVLK